MTLAKDGALRIWRTDSVAGCVVTLRAPSSSPLSCGNIARVSERLSSELSDVGAPSVDLLCLHNGCLEFWSMPEGIKRGSKMASAIGSRSQSHPSLLGAIFNPCTASERVYGLACDGTLQRGCVVSLSQIDLEDEEFTTLTLYDPFTVTKSGTCGMVRMQFHLPAEVHSFVFHGGRLVIAGGLEPSLHGTETSWICAQSQAKSDAWALPQLACAGKLTAVRASTGRHCHAPDRMHLTVHPVRHRVLLRREPHVQPVRRRHLPGTGLASGGRHTPDAGAHRAKRALQPRPRRGAAQLPRLWLRRRTRAAQALRGVRLRPVLQ